MSGNSKRRFSQPDYFKFCKWLEGNKAKLLENKPGFATIAKQMSKELGFVDGIPTGTVQRAMETVGIQYEPAGKSSPLTRMELKLSRHQKLIENLYQMLGAPLPSELEPPPSQVANENGGVK